MEEGDSHTYIHRDSYMSHLRSIYPFLKLTLIFFKKKKEIDEYVTFTDEPNFQFH